LKCFIISVTYFPFGVIYVNVNTTYRT